jgi:hypothetical protein
VNSDEMSDDSSSDHKGKVTLIRAPSFFETTTKESPKAEPEKSPFSINVDVIEVKSKENTKEPKTTSARAGKPLSAREGRPNSARNSINFGTPRIKIESASEARSLIEEMKAGDGSVFTRFFEFCEKENADAHLRFYQQVQAFERIENETVRRMTAKEIQNTFLTSDSRWPLRLTPAIASELAKVMDLCPRDSFASAVDHVLEQIIPLLKKFKTESLKKPSVRLMPTLIKNPSS